MLQIFKCETKKKTPKKPAQNFKNVVKTYRVKSGHFDLCYSHTLGKIDLATAAWPNIPLL